jgi:hypothetical protein
MVKFLMLYYELNGSGHMDLSLGASDGRSWRCGGFVKDFGTKGSHLKSNGRQAFHSSWHALPIFRKNIWNKPPAAVSNFRGIVVKCRLF